jgi:hypothetical protein
MMSALKMGSSAEAEGMRIASGLVPAAKMKGDDAVDTRLLREMSAEAKQYISSFSWCGSVVDSYFAGGVGGIFAVFLFRIQPGRRGISPWIWIMVGDIPPAYLPLDDCSSAAEAFGMYIRGMSKWVEFARKGKTGTAGQGVPPVNVPATPEWAERLDQKLQGLNTAIRPFFEVEGEKGENCAGPSVVKRERESARRLAALGGIAPNLPDIPRRKAPTAKLHRTRRPH